MGDIVYDIPSACLREASEDVGHGLVVHLVGAVEHVAGQG